MPERGFNTEFWADTFIEDLPSEGKFLYIYLWTNPHCNQAGLYKITLGRIAYETKLPIENLPILMKSLESKVKWYPEENLVWVKNFIKHQSRSPKFLIAVANRLKDVNNNGVVKELLEYNIEKYSISIPYVYNKDTVSIPYRYNTGASANAISSANKGGLGGKEKEKLKEKEESFDIFWKAYPRKKSKGQAEKAFYKINPDEQLLATMLAIIERATKSADWLKEDGRYIPYPATWLNAKGWEDEIEERSRDGAYRQNHKGTKLPSSYTEPPPDPRLESFAAEDAGGSGSEFEREP